MKLAQALIERGDLQKRIAQLQNRLRQNAKVQEGEHPAENPEDLLAELTLCLEQLENLITRINLTNARMPQEGECLTALLAHRETMSIKIVAMRDFLESASSTVMRGTRSEVIIRSTVSVAALQKQVDALSKELRMLDIRIQELNWTIELL